jgi:hypothetical protein
MYQYITMYDIILNQSECRKLHIHLWNYWLKKDMCLSHVRVFFLRCTRCTSSTSRIRNFIDGNTALKLYKAYILSQFDYCCPLLIGISNTLSDKIERTNHYVLRTLFKLPKSTEYSTILSQYNLETIKQRRLLQSLIHNCLLRLS